MIIDNIIVIVVAVILITYLSINYVKKYAPGNLILVSILAFCLGIYVPIVIFNVYLRIRYQIPLFIGIFALPCVFAILQYNNISFSKKILYKKAEKYYLDKKYAKCITAIQKMFARNEKNSDTLYLMAKCYDELGEYKTAKEVLYDLLNIDENNYKAYFKLGNILEKEDDNDSAIDMYEQCLDIEPSCYDAYEALGILLANKGEYKEAEDLYKRAIEYHAESYELLYNLAMVQLELSKTDEAEKNLELALVINPDINEAIYSLGNIKLLKGNYNDALNLYSEIIKSENYGLKAYYKIAIIYVTKNEFDKAMNIIEHLINEDSSYIEQIKNEFVFNSMRSRIDAFLSARSRAEEFDKEVQEKVTEEIKNNRKSWFGREKAEADVPKESILYDDIDISRTGFRAEQAKK